MIRFPTAASAALLASVLALTACNSAPMSSGTHTMVSSLSGAGEVPLVNSAGTGTAEVSYNIDTHLLRWTVTYSGLSGPVTGGHFHGPAMAGQNAPVALPFTGTMASPISGSVILTPAQTSELLAGKWYVNLHTAANPGGEIRGQVATGN